MEPKTYEIVDSVEKLNEALVRVRAAQKIFATYTQEQVDKIFLAAASAADKARITMPPSISTMHIRRPRPAELSRKIRHSASRRSLSLSALLPLLSPPPTPPLPLSSSAFSHSRHVTL